MSKYTATFNRTEKKYILTQRQYLNLIAGMKDFVNDDQFGSYTICNIYFDNSNFESIIRSQEKPIYKEKLRVRSYNTPLTDSDPVYIEIKKKFSGAVFKRRVQMNLSDVNSYTFDEKNPEKMCQVMREIDYVRRKDKLRPIIYIAYDRQAYIDKSNHNVRITFDSNLRFRTNDIHLESGDHGHPVSENLFILEIKVADSIPLWLVNLLSKNRIYPQSYSKYGQCYEALNKRKEALIP